MIKNETMLIDKSVIGDIDKWYSAYIFPLVPRYTYRSKDSHNEMKWSFKWLFFHFWSLSNMQFELSIICDTHLGGGSSRISSDRFGVSEFVGIEIDDEHFNDHKKRWSIYKSQPKLALW